MQKILIVRFSSIGDIVLTTPVIRCVKEQTGAEVHYLTKAGFRSILEHNPYIDRVWTIKKDLSEIASDLRKEGFSAMIDLHNNLRSRHLSLLLWSTKKYRFDKLNWQKWLLTKWQINRMPDVHIVERYLAAVAPLGVKNDGKGLDYFPGIETLAGDFNVAASTVFSQPYLAFVIGAAHATKCLTEAQMIDFCRSYQRSILLLGGPGEKEKGARIAQQSGPHVINTCGQFKLNESALLVRDAAAVLTHDTGLMHIAAAFRKPIISVWGNTVPDLGMYPYLPGEEALEKERRVETLGLSCRPCSKIGYSKCPLEHFDCIKQIRMEEVLAKVRGVL